MDGGNTGNAGVVSSAITQHVLPKMCLKQSIDIKSITQTIDHFIL